ncbi:MAG: erythromycin esterase [Saprospiraceae bacterium]|jgi:erythromycin esterase
METLNKSNNSTQIIEILKNHSSPLDNRKDLDPLMDCIKDAKFVLLGEASHGTHEYYTWRAKITQRLIEEKGFSFVGVEGDWPDCYRLNRYAKGYLNPKKDIHGLMNEFKRWPTWMWANWETAAFIDWLKTYNEELPSKKRIGFYGLDLYSFGESMTSIIEFLQKNDQKTLEIAKKVMICFAPYCKDNGKTYAKASAFVPVLCEKEIHTMLSEIIKNKPNYNSDHENVMSTEQNAYIARNAEKYYRAMLKEGPASWNIRDQHMVSCIERLVKFHGEKSKVIVWAHNTHIGDARATDMASEGMVNVGQLLREKYAIDDVIAIGFGSYKGSVIAGRNWGDDMRKLKLPDAEVGSWEHLFHIASNGENRLLLMNNIREYQYLSDYIPHRAVGVVYHPQHEKYGNYIPTIMPKRYDAFIYLDETIALHPLHIRPEGNKIPETYPFGMYNNTDTCKKRV